MDKKKLRKLSRIVLWSILSIISLIAVILFILELSKTLKSMKEAKEKSTGSTTFIRIEDKPCNNGYLVYDKDTYVIYHVGNQGNMTILENADGTPRLYKEKDDNSYINLEESNKNDDN